MLGCNEGDLVKSVSGRVKSNMAASTLALKVSGGRMVGGVAGGRDKNDVLGEFEPALEREGEVVPSIWEPAKSSMLNSSSKLIGFEVAEDGALCCS